MTPTSPSPSSRPRGVRWWLIVTLLLLAAVSIFGWRLKEQRVEPTVPDDALLQMEETGKVWDRTSDPPIRQPVPPAPVTAPAPDVPDPSETDPPVAPPTSSVPDPKEIDEPATPSVPDPKEIDRTVDPRQ